LAALALLDPRSREYVMSPSRLAAILRRRQQKSCDVEDNMQRPNHLLELHVPDSLDWDPQLDNTRMVVIADDDSAGSRSGWS
jgi:hypothetical protein